MKKLYVNEIFESIQGEGYHTGRMAIFIRFAGCNLRCKFCDTKYAWDTKYGTEYDPVDLALLVHASFSANFVVLTGGEPTIQDFDSLKELVYKLKDLGYYVAIETNGTKKIDKVHLPVDWITISPKTALFSTGDEIKLIYDGLEDLEFYEQFDFKYFYLQPELPERGIDNEEGGLAVIVSDILKRFKVVFEAVKKRPLWRISFQTQKLVSFK